MAFHFYRLFPDFMGLVGRKACAAFPPPDDGGLKSFLIRPSPCLLSSDYF